MWSCVISVMAPASVSMRCARLCLAGTAFSNAGQALLIHTRASVLSSSSRRPPSVPRYRPRNPYLGRNVAAGGLGATVGSAGAAPTQPTPASAAAPPKIGSDAKRSVGGQRSAGGERQIRITAPPSPSSAAQSAGSSGSSVAEVNLPHPEDGRHSLVTGVQAVLALLRHRPTDIQRVYITEETARLYCGPLMRFCAEKHLPYHVVSADDLNRVIGSSTVPHEGVCVMRTALPVLDAADAAALALDPRARVVLWAENLHLGAQLGNLLRAAAFFDASAILLSRTESPAGERARALLRDPLNSSVVRVAEGAAEHVPVARLAAPRDVSLLLDSYRAAQWTIVAVDSGGSAATAAVTAAAAGGGGGGGGGGGSSRGSAAASSVHTAGAAAAPTPLRQLDWSRDTDALLSLSREAPRVLLLLGAEAGGLSLALRQSADISVRFAAGDGTLSTAQRALLLLGDLCRGRTGTERGQKGVKPHAQGMDAANGKSAVRVEKQKKGEQETKENKERKAAKPTKGATPAAAAARAPGPNQAGTAGKTTADKPGRKGK